MAASPPLSPYHYLNRDRMLHSIKIFGGAATFCTRFIKTFKYTTEGSLGYPVLPNAAAFFASNLTTWMLLTATRFTSFQFNLFAHGIGNANMSVTLVGGRLLALVETDLPYKIQITPDGDIATVSRHDFGGEGKRLLTMTAHPKTDPNTTRPSPSATLSSLPTSRFSGSTHTGESTPTSTSPPWEAAPWFTITPSPKTSPRFQIPKS